MSPYHTLFLVLFYYLSIYQLVNNPTIKAIKFNRLQSAAISRNEYITGDHWQGLKNIMTPPVKDATFDDLKEHRIEKNGAIAKLLKAQMAMVNFSGSEFMEKIWTENDMSNRHTAVPRLELLPEPIRNKHRGMFQYLKFFQTWIKPVAAEFVATWMLVFWACMLQPPPVDIAVSNSTGIGTGPDSSTDALAPALAAGINLIIIICMFWDICIIQFNPCVTVALVFAQVIPWRLLVPNILGKGIDKFLFLSINMLYLNVSYDKFQLNWAVLRSRHILLHF